MLKVCWCLLFLVVAKCAGDADLCANKKSSDKCLCRRYTDSDTHLPNTEADCTASRHQVFPDMRLLPSNINVLDLSFNFLTILDPTDTQVSSETLKQLIVSHNRINYVDDRFFKNLPNLRYLDLSFNNISSLEDGDIFQNLKQLTHLDVSFNNLKVLPDNVLDPVLSLKYLDVSYNDLGNYFMQSKDVLSRILGLSTNVTHLGLEYVGLNDLHSSFFESYDNLKYISFADNNFDVIPNVPYSVEYLDFSGNNLSYVSAKYLNYHSLKTLKLSRMPSLTSIHHYAFYNLQSLEKLVITDCPNLEEFSELAFGVASKTTEVHPKYLSLARNGLHTLNSTYMYLFRKMEHIDLRHNPWNCDCDILWLQEFETELYRGYDIRCTFPRNLRHRSLIDLTDEDLQSCYPEIYGKQSHRILIGALMAFIVLLIGLIFYLMRYPSSWLGPRRVGVGPNSPYNPAPTFEA